MAQGVTPTATATPAPPPPPTNTPRPRVIENVTLASNKAGVLEVSWDAPSQAPIDYRVSWAEAGESFKTWTDSSGNAFPASPSYTITGLDHGVLYKVRARARYNGSAGPWSAIAEALVSSASTDTPIPPSDTPAPTDAKAVANVQLSSNQPSVLEVSWDAPSQTPRDYRINWAKVGEDFPLINENIGNAFPTSPSYTISGLEQGVTYNVRLRSRYSGEPNGDWTSDYSAEIASS